MPTGSQSSTSFGCCEVNERGRRTDDEKRSADERNQVAERKDWRDDDARIVAQLSNLGRASFLLRSWGDHDR